MKNCTVIKINKNTAINKTWMGFTKEGKPKIIHILYFQLYKAQNW